VALFLEDHPKISEIILNSACHSINFVEEANRLAALGPRKLIRVKRSINHKAEENPESVEDTKKEETNGQNQTEEVKLQETEKGQDNNKTVTAE